MRFLYESTSVTSGAGFRSSLCTVLAAAIYIRYTTIYCNIFFGKCKCTIINFTFASFPPSGTFPFNFSHIKHRRMPLQAHEAPPSMFSGSILAHLLRMGDEPNVVEWRLLAIVQTTYLPYHNVYKTVPYVVCVVDLNHAHRTYVDTRPRESSVWVLILIESRRRSFGKELFRS